MKPIALFLLALLFVQRTVQAGIWVVAKDGSGQFAEIQPAVDAATPGDTILVRAGSYGPVVIKKPLALIGKSPNTVSITNFTPLGAFVGDSAVIVRGVPSGMVLLSSMSLDSRVTLSIQDCGAEVVLNDLVVSGHSSSGTTLWKGNAIAATNASLVFLQGVNCTDAGGCCGSAVAGLAEFSTTSLVAISQSNFRAADNTGSRSVWMDAGRLFATRSNFTGGSGNPGGFNQQPPFCFLIQAAPGGDGLFFSGIDASLIGDASTSYKGGDGGKGGSFPCGSTPNKSGGNGIVAANAATVRYAGGTPQGGLPGGLGAQPGLATSGGVSQIDFLPSSRVTGSTALEGSYALKFQGLPGDLLFVLYSGQVDFLPVPGVEGHSLLLSVGAQDAGWFFGGFFGPTGEAKFEGVVPNDPAFLGGVLFTQGLVSSPVHAHPLQLTNLSYLVIGEK